MKGESPSWRARRKRPTRPTTGLPGGLPRGEEAGAPLLRTPGGAPHEAHPARLAPPAPSCHAMPSSLPPGVTCCGRTCFTLTSSTRGRRGRPSCAPDATQGSTRGRWELRPCTGPAQALHRPCRPCSVCMEATPLRWHRAAARVQPERACCSYRCRRAALGSLGHQRAVCSAGTPSGSLGGAWGRLGAVLRGVLWLHGLTAPSAPIISMARLRLLRWDTIGGSQQDLQTPATGPKPDSDHVWIYLRHPLTPPQELQGLLRGLQQATGPVPRLCLRRHCRQGARSF